MKAFTTTAAIAVFFTANVALAADDTQIGCYKEQGPLENGDTFTYQSIGHCRDLCTKKGKPLLGLSQGNHCYCSDKLPSDSLKTDSDNCDSPCDGYPQNICKFVISN